MSQRKKRPRTTDDSDDEDYLTPTQQRSRRSHKSFIERRRTREEHSASTDFTFDRSSTSQVSQEMSESGRFLLRGLYEPSTSTDFTSERPSGGHVSTDVWRDRPSKMDKPSDSIASTSARPSAGHAKPTETHKINFMQISAGNFDKTTLYDIEGYVRQKSVKCPGKDFSHCVLFDHNKNYDVTYAADFHFTDTIALHFGQKITFKCHVEEAHEKKTLKTLSVMPGSIVVMAETYPFDRIPCTKFTFV